jgi:hypothetical protein
MRARVYVTTNASRGGQAMNASVSGLWQGTSTQDMGVYRYWSKLSQSRTVTQHASAVTEPRQTREIAIAIRDRDSSASNYGRVWLILPMSSPRTLQLWPI